MASNHKAPTADDNVVVIGREVLRQQEFPDAWDTDIVANIANDVPAATHADPPSSSGSIASSWIRGSMLPPVIFAET